MLADLRFEFRGHEFTVICNVLFWTLKFFLSLNKSLRCSWIYRRMIRLFRCQLDQYSCNEDGDWVQVRSDRRKPGKTQGFKW